MKRFVLSGPNPIFGSPKKTSSEHHRRALPVRCITAALLSAGLLVAIPTFANVSVPNKAQEQSGPTKAIEAQIDKQTAAAAAEKRKQLLTDAAAAIAQTQQAVKALDDKKSDVALKALADATGKLALMLSRDPSLKLAPIATDVVTMDVFAKPETIKLTLAEARKALSDNDIRTVRSLVDLLASEVQIRTTHIPLATYPAAIKAATPLIDAGKLDEARTQLQAALGTIVVTTDVIPLPKLRAENLLKGAQALTEKNNRSKEENDKLANDLKTVREQLQIAELLGYGKKRDFKPLYAQLDAIEKSAAQGSSNTGWFDKIRKQVAEVF